MIENIPKLKFKNDYALLRFTFFLNKNEINYKINNNEVFIPPDIDILKSRFENGRSIYDMYKWYIETFKPKPFYKLRKWFNNIINAVRIPRWLLVVIVLIFVLSIGGRAVVDKFQDMSLGQKIENITKVANATQDINETIDNTKDNAATALNKFFVTGKEEPKIIPPKQEIKFKTNNLFVIVFGSMLTVLALIGAVITYLHKDELLSLWQKK